MSVVLDRIRKLLKPIDRVIAKGKERQENIWCNREVDYLPIVFAVEVPEKEKNHSYNLKEQFFDKEKMLQEQLWPVIIHSRSHSAAQLSLRANLGTGFVPTVFGLEADFERVKMVSTIINKQGIDR